jgi:hypothetical protein
MLVVAMGGCAEDESLSGNERRSTRETHGLELEDPNRPPQQRQVFFGDLHIHSSWSLDAYASGVTAGPEEAYRYAQGESIPHIGGASIQLAGPPLDFIALTEHAEYLGVINAATQRGHPLRKQPIFQSWLSSDSDIALAAGNTILDSFGTQQALPELVEGSVITPAWQELIALADRHNRPGLFTAFVGFEYTSNPGAQNLHRNVIFRGSDVPDRPFSAMDSNNPEDLWDWMDGARSTGDDLLAIPHNSNGSNGLMFARTRFNGQPIDRTWAEQRLRNEPIVEVMQIKGQSETNPILSPDDEWAGFEVAPWLTGDPSLPSQPVGSYVRDALKAGLQIEGQIGLNPFAVGMIGSTDGHNASSPFEEKNYTGKIGILDGTPQSRLAGSVPTAASSKLDPDVVTFWSAAGLAGIWADANTRADLFDALRRRETFSTSGPRIGVRLFGGWDFESVDAELEIADIGYTRGVPMGGDLPTNSSGNAPTFLLAAQKDPLEADLERIQIIKGWTADGRTQEQVFDVACSGDDVPDPERHRCPDRMAQRVLKSCAPDATSGTQAFNTWWRDPDFDPTESAFYYVRVLQVPTCRWSTYDAVRLGIQPPSFVPAVIRERAITSPIWYEPS